MLLVAAGSEDHLGDLEARVEVCVRPQVQRVAEQLVVIQRETAVARPLALRDDDRWPVEPPHREPHDELPLARVAENAREELEQRRLKDRRAGLEVQEHLEVHAGVPHPDLLVAVERREPAVGARPPVQQMLKRELALERQRLPEVRSLVRVAPTKRCWAPRLVCLLEREQLEVRLQQLTAKEPRPHRKSL